MLTLAAIQPVSLRGDLVANIDEHVRLARRAAAEGVTLAVFPELSLTGYELDLASELAFSVDDPRLAPLREVAESCGATLIVGAPIRLDSGLHIGAFAIEPDGRIAVYTKHHLWGDEKAVFVPGDRNPLLAGGADRAALAICADTAHAEHVEAAAERGATLYLAGVFFDPASYATSAGRLEACAAQHAMAVVMANAGGPATGFEAAGGSAIWSPTGELVARLAGIGSGFVIARRDVGDWRGEAVALAR